MDKKEEDRKYLVKRNKCWYLDCRIPKRLGGGRLRQSLGTADIKRAKYIRDKYVVPIMLNDNVIDILQEIARQCTEILSESQKNIAVLKNIKIAENSFLLHQCIDKYLLFIENNNLRKKTIQSYNSSLAKMKILFSDCMIDHISKDMAINAKEKMIEGDGVNKIGATRIKFDFQVWRGLLRWTKEQGYTNVDVSEMLMIPLPKVRKVNTAYIPGEKADEAMAVLENWTLAPMIARYTGMRLGEVLSMTNDSIKKIQGVKCFYIPPEISKTHTERYVPIADKLLKYIDNFSELAKTGKKNDKYNKEIKKIEGCERCSFHSWRVYANTQMMQSGVDETVRKRVIGHKDGKDEIHAGYTYVRMEEMKKAVDKIF